ncbi:ABC transporter ATP-binding protein [Lachnospiraceae bacterium 38-14]|uniref:ABC transporter ATP-binding protein n=1 Tax=Roseburia sp. 1XD42-69 TaxID=2320088 RepID=UPI000EA35B20|nr:ABC transporter ATP-binding protein [Roseburia sp. 1XD42-69]RKJ63295.1 ABC transporter ATP-binding protein [Roseburia sp. 1XD42-69]
MRYMKEVLRNNKKWVIVYLLIGLFNAFMSNYKADYFQKVIDGLTDRTITIYGILFYGAILFINYGINYIDEYPSAKLGNEIYLDFKLLALRKIGRMDYFEYQKLGTGKLVQQIENGANAGKGVLYDFWFSVVRNLLPTILFSLYFIWKIDRTITYFLLAGYIIVFLVTNLLLQGLYQIKEKILTNEEELNHFLVRGFMEMPIFRMKHQFPNEVKKALGAKRVIVSSKVKMTMIHEAFFTIFALLVTCLDVGILAYAWRNNHLSIGSVVALITLIDNAYTPIAIFNVIYVQYKLNKTAWMRFTGLLDLKEDTQLEQGIDFPAPLSEIHVEDVSFSYENKEVLQSVRLTIKRGEKIAFVGESGSGKSTLTKILVGLLKYDKGNILFDDEPLKNISLESLYEKVSYLSQDTPVFDGTIRENLVFDREVSENDIHVCLEKTHLLSLLAALDKGVETKIGEKGTCLSGGEKQRLALARLWFDNSDIVVLDEATSALDNVTEGIVMKNVLEQIKHATVIAVAHRLTSIREFDRIIVFRNGKIVGNGTFDELLENNSYFFDLYKKEKENSN